MVTCGVVESGGVVVESSGAQGYMLVVQDTLRSLAPCLRLDVAVRRNRRGSAATGGGSAAEPVTPRTPGVPSTPGSCLGRGESRACPVALSRHKKTPSVCVCVCVCVQSWTSAS